MKKILLFLVGMLLIVSCGGNQGKKESGSSASFNMEAEPASLDPQLLTDMGGFMVSGMLYEGLVRLNEKHEIVPAGAESWNVSEDGKIWTFKIRQGMKWSNGDTVTAHDYLRGMKRGLDPATAAEYAFIMYYIQGAEDYNTGKTQDFNGVGIKVKDDYTLEITLSKPAAYFGKTLIMPIYFPLNEKAIAEYKDKYATEADKSIYNGPYTMKEWVHDNRVVMEKNPNYWNKDNIKIDTLTAMMVTDFEAATNLFENKELDLTRISVEKIVSFNGKPELHKVPDGRVYYLAFNQNNPILKNKKVRQALSLAVDRETLVKDILNEGGIKASGIVANGMPGVTGDFRDESGDLYAQHKDLDVKKLFEEGLKELGMTPDQVKLTLTADEKGTGKKESEFYQSQWKEKLGIDVDVEIITYKERLSRGNEGNYEIIRYAWGPDYADAMTYMELFLTGTGLNVSRYSNPEYDKLVAFAQESNDHKARIEAMQKAEKMLMEDYNVSGLYYQVAAYLINPNLKGVSISAVGNPIDFYNASIKE
ncbi:MAG: peptide ABC transporter substrate-binding protein [Leptotrichiaceae bacterium]|nr:peptide ABC transporter substrate-binding protein [Leptotrichiaceae bacterium]